MDHGRLPIRPANGSPRATQSNFNFRASRRPGRDFCNTLDGCQLGQRWVVHPGTTVVRRTQGFVNGVMARLDFGAAKLLSTVKGEPLPKMIPPGIAMELLGVALRATKVSRAVSRVWVRQQPKGLEQAGILDVLLQASSFAGLPSLLNGLSSAGGTLWSHQSLRQRSAAALQVMDSVAGLGWFSMSLCEMLYQTGMVGKMALAWMGPLTPVFGVLQMGSGFVDLLACYDARQLQQSLQKIEIETNEAGEEILSLEGLKKALGVLENRDAKFLQRHFQIDYSPTEELGWAVDHFKDKDDTGKKAANLVRTLKGRVSSNITHHALAGTATLVGTVALSALYLAPALLIGECLLAAAVVIGFVEAVHHLGQFAFQPERLSEKSVNVEKVLEEPSSPRAVNILLDRWFGLAL